MSIDLLLKWKQFAYAGKWIDRIRMVRGAERTMLARQAAGSDLCLGEEGLAAVRQVMFRAFWHHFGAMENA